MVSSFCCVPFRLAESNKNSSTSTSEPCPETTSEPASSEDNRENLAPLNLSTRNPDRDRSPPEHRPRCSDTETLKQGEELPLNLSLRASHNPASSPGAADPQRWPEVELDEEPCDQRQTAALALCQLSIASSVASSCDFSTAGGASEDYTEATIPSSPKKTKHRIKGKSLGVKRANSSPADNNCHKPNKRAKTAARTLRRRPRCC